MKKISNKQMLNINFTVEQYQFLTSIKESTNLSYSKVVRYIIDRTINNLKESKGDNQ